MCLSLSLSDRNCSSVAHTQMFFIPLSLLSARPTITVRPPSSLVVNEGSSFTIPCQAVGDPKPAIGWFRNQTFLPERDVHIQEAVGNLMFISARPEDDGDYTCVAANSAGQEEARIRLTVISMWFDKLTNCFSESN